MNNLAGIGNEFRGDDAVGLLIAKKIRSQQLANVQVVTLSDHLDNLLDLWADREFVILVDAVRSEAAPGSIIYLDLFNDSLPPTLAATSTHALDILQLVQLARLLNRLPQSLAIVGIEGSSFAIGAEMTDPVRSALPKATEKILALFLEAGIE